MTARPKIFRELSNAKRPPIMVEVLDMSQLHLGDYVRVSTGLTPVDGYTVHRGLYLGEQRIRHGSGDDGFGNIDVFVLMVDTGIRRIDRGLVGMIHILSRLGPVPTGSDPD